MYTDPVYFLNGLLFELDHEQNAEDWSYDALRPGFTGWWTANNPDTGELLQVYVEHVSADACGTTALSLETR